MPRYMVTVPAYFRQAYVFHNPNDPLVLDIPEGTPVPSAWKLLEEGETPTRAVTQKVAPGTMSAMAKAQAEREKQSMDRLTGGKDKPKTP